MNTALSIARQIIRLAPHIVNPDSAHKQHLDPKECGSAFC
jgi:hypothetical protein